jgi:hypothetical protein
MQRNLRTLALALAAVFAMSAVAAQAASATSHTFVTESGNPAYLTGTQETGTVNALTFTGSGESIECESAHYESTGTVASGEEEITVHPVFEECYSGLAPNPGEVVLRTNECHITLTGTTDGNGHAETHINCGASPIETEVPGACTFTIGTQTPTGGGVHYTNHTSGPKDFTVQATVEGVDYHAHGPLCFLVASGEISSETFTDDDLDFTSSITFKCYKNAAHTEPEGCTINGATNEV